MPKIFDLVTLHLYSLQPFRRFLRLTFPLCNWKLNTETQNCSEKKDKTISVGKLLPKIKERIF